jgi:hypothetical protein
MGQEVVRPRPGGGRTDGRMDILSYLQRQHIEGNVSPAWGHFTSVKKQTNTQK